MTDTLDNLRHREFDGVATLGELAAIDEIERLRSMNDLLKREVLAADAIVKIGGREMVCHALIKAEIENLRAAVKDALARLEKGAPGWGVAKDVLRTALQPST